jgi:hypothetical protein
MSVPTLSDKEIADAYITVLREGKGKILPSEAALLISMAALRRGVFLQTEDVIVAYARDRGICHLSLN